MLFDIGTQGGVAAISPAPEGRVYFVRLNVAYLFSKVVKAERQIVAWVQETTLTQVTVFCDQNLKEERKKKKNLQ